MSTFPWKCKPCCFAKIKRHHPWLDGLLVSSCASKGHPFQAQKSSNSNSLYSPIFMRQLKGWWETCHPGQHEDTLEDVKSKATFVILFPLWQRLPLQRDGETQGQLEPAVSKSLQRQLFPPSERNLWRLFLKAHPFQRLSPSGKATFAWFSDGITWQKL